MHNKFIRYALFILLFGITASPILLSPTLTVDVKYFSLVLTIFSMLVSVYIMINIYTYFLINFALSTKEKNSFYINLFLLYFCIESLLNLIVNALQIYVDFVLLIRPAMLIMLLNLYLLWRKRKPYRRIIGFCGSFYVVIFVFSIIGRLLAHAQ